jgi:2'-5' RNA ligase
VPRLFVGTFLPENDRAALLVDAESDERLSALWNRKIRWVRPDKLHLTWLFLGKVDDALVPELQLKVAEIFRDASPMDLHYSKPTLWPSARNARVFVLEPETVPDQLMQLAERCRKELKPYAEKIDLKYRPHITLARMDSSSHKRIAVPDWFPPLKHLPLHHHIDRVDIIESHLTGNKDYLSIAGMDLNT